MSELYKHFFIFGIKLFKRCANSSIFGTTSVWYLVLVCDLSENEVKKVPTVCGSLREAMQSLDKDRKFLTQGNVFTDDQIDAYIELKYEEIHNFEHTPHPIEFDMYYSC